MYDLQQKLAGLSVSDRKWNALDDIMNHFYEQEKVDEKTMKMVNDCAEDLKTHIRKSYPKISVKPYGSLVTGFGSKDSDIDFSLLVHKRQHRIGNISLDEVNVLRKVAKLIGGAQATWNIECRSTAKVPIVCFMWKGLEVDISYVNNEAVKNSELLKHYCEWEPKRLCILGFWVKKWAKAFDMCSKSNGTLSSYTYILMVIYYLQRQMNPVLPCLHNDFSTSKTERRNRSKFYKGVVANWSTNTNSVAELFLGFLDFYSSYDFKRNVIQIISKGEYPRTRNEMDAPIVVRDCIDWNVNIAAHVEEAKMNEILGIIRRSKNELKNWLEGKPVEDETLKKLFNIE